MLVASGHAEHERLQPRVEDERRDGIDQLHFEQFDRRDLCKQETPGVSTAEIDLLQILVEPALGEEIFLRGQLLRKQRDLR